MTGTVISGTQNTFEVEVTDSGEGDSADPPSGGVRILHCTIKGKRLESFGNYYNPLAVGDRVEVECDEYNSDRGQITALFPRRNIVARYNEKKCATQLLASNVDNLFLLTTPVQPDFKPNFIDRALVQCELLHLNPIILCNKYDLLDEGPEVESHLTIWQTLGYQVLRVSARTGEGMSELAFAIEGKLSVLVGQSGVGKSSLINVLDDTCVLKTGSLSKKYGKGVHTTTKGAMIHLTLNTALTGGVQGCHANIIDTPGVKKFTLHGIIQRDLAKYFRDLSPLIEKCQYGPSCTHTTEDGCAVRAALNAGAISDLRYESYLRMRGQLPVSNYEIES